VHHTVATVPSEKNVSTLFPAQFCYSISAVLTFETIVDRFVGKKIRSVLLQCRYRFNLKIIVHRCCNTAATPDPVPCLCIVFSALQIFPSPSHQDACVPCFCGYRVLPRHGSNAHFADHCSCHRCPKYNDGAMRTDVVRVGIDKICFHM
jgi:hypothetical protein